MSLYNHDSVFMVVCKFPKMTFYALLQDLHIICVKQLSYSLDRYSHNLGYVSQLSLIGMPIFSVVFGNHYGNS
jgi:hypothetical protein